MSEMEVAIAQLFLKKGKSSMAERDFVFAASLDLRWFKPNEAQKFLDIGLESELLVRDKDMVKPNFDYKSKKIPPNYAPGPELLKKSVKPKGIFLKIIDSIGMGTAIPRKEIISRVNNTQDRMGIEVEVAALMVARECGIDISEYLDAVEEEIGKRFRD